VENVRQIVARNVRLARQRAEISQEELADRAGIDRSYGSRIERGSANPSVEILAKLAVVLGVSTAALLQDHGAGANNKNNPP
jgi:transcriptional regulator with XRE-family HTH domain